MSRAGSRQPTGKGVNKKYVIYGTIAVLVIAALFAVQRYQSNAVPTASTTVNQSSALKKGDVAPDFSVTTNNGPFALAGINGPVFLEVFATWCPHCQREVPVVDALAKKYAGKVAFVGVDGSANGIDGTSPENEADIAEWVNKLGVSYPVAYDPGLTVANKYLQGGFPTMVLIDGTKHVRFIGSGELPPATLDAAIDNLLSSKS